MNIKSTNEDSELIQSVIEILRQGEALLTKISDESYTLKVPLAFNATIGGHYRHCLDHFRTLFESATTGDLNYDHRERGTLPTTISRSSNCTRPSSLTPKAACIGSAPAEIPLLTWSSCCNRSKR